MFGILGTDAAFANAAGRGGRAKNVLSFIAGDQDMEIYQLSCDGDITIKTIKNGSEYIDTHADLEDATIMLQCDADTKVSIIGDVTKIVFYNWDDDTGQPVNITELNVTKCKTLTSLDISWCQNLTSIDLSKNTALTYLVCSYCSALTSLDLSKNTALSRLECYSCYALTTLDVSNNTALTYLECGSCSALTALDLSKNTALTYLSCTNCTGLTTISYLATNSDVSTAVAGAITAADAADGTVYTDSDGAYYSTIETAANNKGWTIEQL